MLARHQQFSRRQSNLNPAQDTGGSDDWLSNFNDLSATLPTKPRSVSEGNTESEGKDSSTPRNRASTRTTRKERIRSERLQTKNGTEDAAAASKSRSPKNSGLAAKAVAGSNDFTSLRSTLEKTIAQKEPRADAVTSEAPSTRSLEQQATTGSFEKSYPDLLRERLERTEAVHRKAAEANLDFDETSRDGDKSLSSLAFEIRSHHLEKAQLCRDALEAIDESMNGKTGTDRVKPGVKLMSLKPLSMSCLLDDQRYHLKKIEEHKQKLARLDEEGFGKEHHEKQLHSHKMTLMIIEERQGMLEEHRNGSSVNASKAVQRSSEEELQQIEKKPTGSELLSKMIERLEKMKSSHLEAAGQYTADLAESTSLDQVEGSDVTQAKEHNLRQVKVIEDAIAAVNHVLSNGPPVGDAERSFGGKGSALLETVVRMVLSRGNSSLSSDRTRRPHFQRKSVKHRQAAVLARDEKVRSYEAGKAHFYAVYLAIIDARQAVRAEIDATVVKDSSSQPSTAFVRRSAAEPRRSGSNKISRRGLITKLREHLEWQKMSCLEEAEKRTRYSQETLEPGTAEHINITGAQEDALKKIKLLEDAIAVVDVSINPLPKKDSSEDELREAARSESMEDRLVFLDAIAQLVLPQDGSTLGEDRWRQHAFEKRKAKHEQAAHSAGDEETRKHEEAEAYRFSLYLTIINARIGLREDMKARSARTSKPTPSTEFLGSKDQASTNPTKSPSIEDQEARRNPAGDSTSRPAASSAASSTTSIPQTESRRQFEAALPKIKDSINKYWQHLLARMRTPDAQDSTQGQTAPRNASAAGTPDFSPTPSTQVSAPSFASPPSSTDSQLFHSANASMISDLRPIKGEAAYPGFSTSPPPSPPSFVTSKPTTKPDKPLSLAQKVDEAKYRRKWGGIASPMREQAPATPAKAKEPGTTPSNTTTEHEAGLKLKSFPSDSKLERGNPFAVFPPQASDSQQAQQDKPTSVMFADSPGELNEIPVQASRSTGTSASEPDYDKRDSAVARSGVSPSSSFKRTSFDRMKRGLSAELRRKARPEPKTVSVESPKTLASAEEDPAAVTQTDGDEVLDGSEATSKPTVPGETGEASKHAIHSEMQSPSLPRSTLRQSRDAPTTSEYEDRFASLDAQRLKKDGSHMVNERNAAAQNVVDFYSERPEGQRLGSVGSEGQTSSYGSDGASSRLSQMYSTRAVGNGETRSQSEADLTTGEPFQNDVPGTGATGLNELEKVAAVETDDKLSHKASKATKDMLLEKGVPDILRKFDLEKLSFSRRETFAGVVRKQIQEGKIADSTESNRRIEERYYTMLKRDKKDAEKQKTRRREKLEKSNTNTAVSEVGNENKNATADDASVEGASGSVSGNGASGDDDGDERSLSEVMREAEALSTNVTDVAPEAEPDATSEPPPLDLSSSESTDILAIKPSELKVEPLNIPQPSVPGLEYGLDRVLFNPGVYQLQDPLSRVYNFDPYLQKIMPVVEFDFNALKEYKTSSQDQMLSTLAKEHDKRYIGSTSSMTGTLGHFHYLLSDWRPLNLNMFSKAFPEKLDTFTQINRAPNAIFLRWKNGTYAIDADKQYDSGNVLMLLGKSMEKLLTMPKSDYERYRKSDPRTVSEEERNDPEAFEYTTMGDFLMRSQLDAYDSRLPGTGMFDLKTRAVVSVRMDASDFEPMTGYEIHTLQGRFGSYEREYYDMIRSTMLKYMLQARIGRMDGIFVAYHNVERIFGFQYLPIQEMDRALHGQVDRSLGDQEFRTSLDLMNKVFDKATAKFPEQSMRFHFETTTESLGGSPTTVMWIFGEPMQESEIETIQATSKEKVAEFERTMMGVDKDAKNTSTSAEAEVPEEENQSTEEPALTGAPKPSQSTTPKVAHPASTEYVTSDSGADPEFMNSISSQSEMERQPLFAASLICKSRVNGVPVQRPESLKPTDTWEVEYLLREWNAPDAMWSKYEQMKARRREMFERLDSDEEAEDSNGELTKEQQRSKNFIDFLRSMSQQGREFRSKIDQMEAGKKPTVVGQPSNEIIIEGAVGGVDEYMSWLYGGEKK